MDTWSRVATGIFPHLASDPGLAAALDEHARVGTTFYEWDAGVQPGVADLRAHAIQTSRDITAARRRLTPPAAPAQIRRAPGDGGNRPAPLARHAAVLRSIADALDAQRLPEEIASTAGQLRQLAARYENAALPVQPASPEESGTP
jgi:hypothetical protein